MPATPENLFARLDELGIETATHHHAAVFTVEDARARRGALPGGHCKSLFLKDKKAALWLVVALEDTAIDLKVLSKTIGSARLSFARPELLAAVLGVEPGSVTPFALINETASGVNVVLEKAMLARAELNYHPLTNTATTRIRAADLPRFVRACGFEPLILAL